VHVVESAEKVELWYNRLCHMSEKDMVKLCKSNVLSDMSNPHLKKYDHYFVEKKNNFLLRFTHLEDREFLIWCIVIYAVL